MKIKWESRRAKEKRLEKWHVWFAWYPVRIGEGLVWLKFIMRRVEFFYGMSTPEYAEIRSFTTTNSVCSKVDSK
jgi:hypothetical protein